MRQTAVGLMSGTSADGVTAVLARFGAGRVGVLKLATLAYPAALRARVLKASTLAAPELSRLNMELGEHFARAAARVIRGRPAVIGSHGQTVWHGPDETPRNTLQLAEPAVIAERTELPVVADFRPRDIASGGQGAPLVPAFDEFLYARGPLRVLLNVGGIANLSVAGKGRLWQGFDVGPGNCLMDLAVRQATGGSMDRGGALARRGRPDPRAVRRMLRDPFFDSRPPRSLERTYFGEWFLRRHFGRVTRARLADTVATLNLFTASAVADACRRFVRKDVTELVVSGGGALNPALMANLSRELSPVPVVSSLARGLPPMAKEAACFAWMALRAIRGEANNCPAATGAPARRILGKIIPA